MSSIIPLQGSNNDVHGRTVPRITIYKDPDDRSDSTDGHDLDATRDNLSDPAGQFDTEQPHSLDDQLWDQAVPHAKSDVESFWPPRVWKSIVTRQAIVNEVLAQFPDYDQRRAEQVAERVLQDNSGTYLQTFTILVLLEQVPLFVKHVLKCQQGVRDHDLPLQLRKRKGSFKSNLCRADFGAVCCFSNWKPARQESFDRLQRRLAVPVFKMKRDRTLIHLDLDGKDILPWCEEKEVPPIKAMSGGEGTVIRVKIHEECHEFHDTLRAINVAGGIFAVKRLRQQSLDKFRREVDALRRFNGKVHPHLVTLLATFTQAGYYHMIFPWAECDLDLYWEEINPNPDPGDVGLVRWLSRQCVGIMEAVTVIHNPSHLASGDTFGRHGDIKAENILWFKSRPADTNDRGVLVISDLGLTAMNSAKSRSMLVNTNLKMTPSYRAPESDVKGAKISRAFDVWTLGCLYLELACWLLRGYKGKQAFDEARTTPLIYGTRTNIYFDIEERKHTAPGMFVFKVKDVVSKTMSELHDNRHCAQWVHDLLELVQNDMLVVLSKTHKRKSSQELLNRLRTMDRKVQSDARYSSNPVPQSRAPSWRPDVGTMGELNEEAKQFVKDNGVGTHASDERPLQQGENWSG